MPEELKQIPCTVEIRYNPTGEIRSIQQELNEQHEWVDPPARMRYLDEPSCFIWEEGNYSCDCNRALFFHDRSDEAWEQECNDVLYAVRIIDNRTGKVVYDELTD
jgi:hypothetical protein